MMCIGYLISEYPARSHTFIRREVELVRNSNLEVAVFSLRKCAEETLIAPEERIAWDDTWSVLPAKWAELITSHVRFLVSKPMRYLRGLLKSIRYREPTLRGSLYALFHFAEGVYLAAEMERRGVRALHVHFANAGAKVGAVAAELLDIPWMLTLHGSIDFEYPAVLWVGDMVRSAHSVRCVTDYGASQIKRNLTRDEYAKVFVAYCGLPASLVPSRQKDEKSDAVMKLLAVGRLSPEKGQFFLLDAAAELVKRKIDFRLDIVGDGPDRIALESESKTLGLSDTVIFHGAVSEQEVFVRMNDADMFLCTSFMEGLPQVLMESMSVGTPVIAPYIAGIPELVSDGETGFLFPAGNVLELVSKIETLASDSLLKSRISAAAYDRIVSSFLLEDTVSPLIERLRALPSNNPVEDISCAE